MKLPFYIVFRALGMTSDKEIIECIAPTAGSDSSKNIQQLLEEAYNANVPEDLKPIAESIDSNFICSFISQYISSKTNPNTKQASSDVNISKYIYGNFMDTLDKQFLPHIGTLPEYRIKKLRFLGYLLSQFLKVQLGDLKSTDRDSYKNKRVLAPGISLSKAFKTDFNLTVVRELKNTFTKVFKETSFKDVKIAEKIASSIKTEDLGKALSQSIASGLGSITIKKNSVVNRIDSGLLNRKNDLNYKAALNIIATSGNATATQTVRADEMRRVHPSTFGYRDSSQSAETGEEVGMKGNKACTVEISVSTSSAILKKIILGDSDIINLNNISNEKFSKESLARVFVNGDWIGCCKNEFIIYKKYVNKRRYGDIHPTTTIYTEILQRELHFWTDFGRLLRPLIIVYNNIEEYNEASRKGSPIQFKQWIKLTQEHIIKLQAGVLLMEDLQKERIVEYIAPEEQENLYLSFYKDFIAERNNVLKQFTHVDIEQALLGFVTLSIPLPNHSSVVRNTKGALHRKQSACWFALNYPWMIMKNTVLQYYGQRPIVSCISDNFTYPNGANCIVALADYEGWNQEDSICVKKQAVERGLFNGSLYTYEKSELSQGEQFANPDYSKTMDIKKDANYEFIENGFIRKGTVAQKGYVLVSKTAKLPKKSEKKGSEYTHVDKSLICKNGPVIVEDVLPTKKVDEGGMVKIKLRSIRPIIVGDKLCYTGDHEVYTIYGWKSIKSITKDDMCVVLKDDDSYHIDYEMPTNIYEYSNTEPLIHVKNDDIDLLVTPNHNMYVRGVKSSKYEFKSAQSLMYSYSYYKKSDNYHDLVGEIDISLTDECIKLISYIENVELIKDVYSKLTRKERLYVLCNLKATLTSQEIIDWLEDETFNLGLCLDYTPNKISNNETSNDKTIDYNYWDSLIEFKIKSGETLVSPDDYTIIYPSSPLHEKVYCIEVPTHKIYVRRNGKSVWCSQSSRHGNKGIVALMFNEEDGPYTEEGITPDLIVSSESIPTRMAINQLIDGYISVLAAKKGSLFDATAFKKLDIDEITKELESYGLKYKGNQRMYNGKTGCWFDAKIFITPVCYQRISKFILDDRYAMRTGPVNNTTRQPVDGKNASGGVRIGEMEKDCLTAHGAMRAFHEKWYEDSDGVNIQVCRVCGNRVVANEKQIKYQCKTCGYNADICNVPSSWTANLFLNSLESMGVKTKLELEPFAYQEPEPEENE
jgi:DNA-directed RNA polymerase beta subunit